MTGHLQSGIQGEYRRLLETETVLKVTAEYRYTLYLHGLFHPEKQKGYIKNNILGENNQPSKNNYYNLIALNSIPGVWYRIDHWAAID